MDFEKIKELEILEIENKLFEKRAEFWWNEFLTPEYRIKFFLKLFTENTGNSPHFGSDCQIWWNLLSEDKQYDFIRKLFCEHTGQKDPRNYKYNELNFASQIDYRCSMSNLERFAVDSNFLLKIWHEGFFEGDTESFLDSIDHIGFYLNTFAASSITQPKEWIRKTLLQGYYPPPDGYTSLNVRYRERILELKRKKLKLTSSYGRDVTSSNTP